MTRTLLLLPLFLCAASIATSQNYRNIEYGFAVTFPEKPERADLIAEGAQPGMSPPVPFERVIIPVARPRVGIVCLAVAFHIPFGGVQARGMDSLIEAQVLAPMIRSSKDYKLVRDTLIPGAEGRSRIYRMTSPDGLPVYFRADVLIREPIVAAAIYGVHTMDDFNYTPIKTFFRSFRLLDEDSTDYLRRTVLLEDGKCGAKAPAGFLAADESEFEMDLPGTGNDLAVARISLGALNARADLLHVISPKPLDGDDILTAFNDGMMARNTGDMSGLKLKKREKIRRNGIEGERVVYAGTIDGRPGATRLESYRTGNEIYAATWTTSEISMLDRPIVNRFFESLRFPAKGD